jgi:hypothetical protein
MKATLTADLDPLRARGDHQGRGKIQTAGEGTRMFSRIKTLLKLVLNC